ncbi:hypothetical protein GCM10022222_46860 [Amycolatopsis ultiminotia]|uniref:EspG family protein n=1 Tax=Amycolatopsis ultiminotia TaxID=543629 RepID=A0ABP6WZA8_9PSEU
MFCLVCSGERADLVGRSGARLLLDWASLTCSNTDLNTISSGRIPSTTSPSIRDAKHVLRWLNAPHTYFVRLYVAVRDGRGRRRRNEHPPGWADTDQGRVLLSVDSAGWISLAGAAPSDIANKVQRLAHDLRNGS